MFVLITSKDEDGIVNKAAVWQFDNEQGAKAFCRKMNLIDGNTAKIIELFEDYFFDESIKFNDLARLDDRSIQKIFREVDSQDLAMALKKASEETQDRVFGNLSKRAALMLREDMEYMGPIRDSDAEKVQQKRINIYERLVKKGEITDINSNDGEDLGPPENIITFKDKLYPRYNYEGGELDGEKIEQYENTYVCPHCKSESTITKIELGTKKCPVCKKSLKWDYKLWANVGNNVEIQNSKGKLECKYCHEKIKEEYKFCPACGTGFRWE
jgi:Zn finger protein HypA/HybF involved in hydrogenase expression